jgi:hypothetical protein
MGDNIPGQNLVERGFSKPFTRVWQGLEALVDRKCEARQPSACNMARPASSIIFTLIVLSFRCDRLLTLRIVFAVEVQG